jgi:hypothetical protein
VGESREGVVVGRQWGAQQSCRYQHQRGLPTPASDLRQLRGWTGPRGVLTRGLWSVNPRLLITHGEPFGDGWANASKASKSSKLVKVGRVRIYRVWVAGWCARAWWCGNLRRRVEFDRGFHGVTH